MSERENTLSEATRASFDLENIGFEVARLGAGLDALATLMSASDPMQTEGSNSNPILHGLGALVEVIAERVRHHGDAVQGRAEAIRVAPKPDKIKTREDELGALRNFARNAVSETASG